MRDKRIVTHRMPIGLIHHQGFLSEFDERNTVHARAMRESITHIIIKPVPAAGVIKKTIPNTFNLAKTPSTIKNNHVAPTRLHRNAIIKSQKTKTSWNAVGFAITAAEKNSPERIAYIVVSLSCTALWRVCVSPVLVRKRNHPISASIDNAITPRSVLLSTKTRKAPIPLITHSKKYIHPNANGRCVRSVFFPSHAIVGMKKFITLRNAPSPKTSASGQLIKFKTTATVSGARPIILERGCISENRYAI